MESKAAKYKQHYKQIPYILIQTQYMYDKVPLLVPFKKTSTRLWSWAQAERYSIMIWTLSKAAVGRKVQSHGVHPSTPTHPSSSPTLLHGTIIGLQWEYTGQEDGVGLQRPQTLSLLLLFQAGTRKPIHTSCSMNQHISFQSPNL